MSQNDEALIRDADLRKQLEDARGGFAFNSLVGVLIHTQTKRDAAREAEAAREAKLAAMPREKRMR